MHAETIRASSSDAPGAQSAALESNALVAFFLTAVPATYSVDLFGSWDNFSTAYPMAKDSRRGRGHWRGIHSFTNIICDGDPSRTSARRDGALRAGGLYWYYYRLNGDLECHNPSEPSTTSCPLLPGQRVNVLEVPLELPCFASPAAIDSNLGECMTLNPKDRWAPLKRKRNEQKAAPSRNAELDKKRREYLAKETGRLFTAAAEAIILAYAGHKLPQVARTTTKRPKSCSELFAGHGSFQDTFRRFSSIRDASARSEEPSTARNRSVQEARQCRWPAPRRLRLQHPASVFRTRGSEKFPSPQRIPASRGQTAMPALSTEDADSESEEQTFDDDSTTARPASAPMAMSGSDSHALAPSVSNTIDNAPVAAEQQQQRSDGFEAVPAPYEICHSPPQLSISSRESRPWTPESESVKTGSDLWGQSQRGSFRYSLESALTVYDDDEEDDKDDVRVGSAKDDGGKAADRLGLQFSSLGLGSQETIKPPRTISVDLQPFDSDWNPFCRLGGPAEQTTAKPALAPRRAGQLSAQAAVGGNDMMDELSFLGAAINL